MKLISTGMVAAALTGLLAITSIVPAQAQSVTFGANQRDRVITSYCESHRRDPDCRRFQNGNWNNGDYDNFYRRNRGGLDNIASGFFGFTFGAILGSALANGNNGGGNVVVRRGNSYEAHVEACYDRYRSYDEETDSFMGYDGRRHRCNL
ncbi:BA14K family protein [Devosia sp. SL43]|uniref:BA14K family protein n=1 Tax=Devosia sp. SL43 TaxID=2806348 RepID=UPI001F396618|nr:BA14K family protein [Devosia sp. SL43]UJW85817.1 BA14K family protein [Devosia sp. SL43]